jgi:predicted AlkP superfamily phosphohydrolase/phosphomutase
MSREARERLLARAFRGSTDWARATAFVIPSAYTSFVRVNLAGREPLGTVAPGADYEAVLDRLEADLRRLIDPATGEPAVVAVHRANRLFGDGPPEILPDLFVEWKPGRWMNRVVHPDIGTIEVRKPDFFRRSDHHDAGFIALAGPSVTARGRRPDVDALDLAPMFLSLLGEPIPDELPGRPRADLTTSAEPALAPS